MRLNNIVTKHLTSEAKIPHSATQAKDWQSFKSLVSEYWAFKTTYEM